MPQKAQESWALAPEDFWLIRAKSIYETRLKKRCSE
jgi:hypothetical protein